MIINNAGYNHCHDADFFIDRPYGSGDNLFLLLKTDTIFTIDEKDIIVPANSIFIYKKDTPQYYRCLPNCTFSNDWLHFLFENGEEEEFLKLGIMYETPYLLDNISFTSFCIKSIAYECYSDSLNMESNIKYYVFLMLNKISDYINTQKIPISDNHFEMLSTIKNKIYSRPYEQRTINSTAHEVRMSKSSFQHLYKKYFGITFINDLINSRIEYAKMLLENTDLNSEDIAKQSGYHNYAHFARQFKDKTSFTPLKYRKNVLINKKDIPETSTKM